MLGRRIAARQPPPTFLPELRRALLDEWCTIPQDQIDNLILSMPRRSEMALIREKAQCVSWDHETKSPTNLQRTFRHCYGSKPPDANNRTLFYLLHRSSEGSGVPDMGTPLHTTPPPPLNQPPAEVARFAEWLWLRTLGRNIAGLNHGATDINLWRLNMSSPWCGLTVRKGRCQPVHWKDASLPKIYSRSRQLCGCGVSTNRIQGDSQSTNTPPPQPPSDKTDPEPTHSPLTPKPTYPFPPPPTNHSKQTNGQTDTILRDWKTGGEHPPGRPSGGTQVL
ncbi:transposable element Tc3 transposase [Trichonephila clavipes]|uniref:Transposable element Tc3 transposase n=1 Tax=Trichonephila clavipes TaxID=2585209 RepID=A0A8X6SI87_TRICX|nr:transposable element Tc3 transposase [Trichonephila clavipes]